MSNLIENVTPEQWANAERITLIRNLVGRHDVDGRLHISTIRSAGDDE